MPFDFLNENSYDPTVPGAAEDPFKKKKAGSFEFLDETQYISSPQAISDAVYSASKSVVEEKKPKGFVEKYLAFSDRLGQLGAEIDVGFVKSTGSILSDVQRLAEIPSNALFKAIDKSLGETNVDEPLYNIGDHILKLGEAMDKHTGVTEKNYLDNVFEGIGSSIPYLVGGATGKAFGISKNLLALGLGGTEALVNAYDDYDQLKKDGTTGSDKLKAIASFGGNLAINFITDRLGFLSEGTTKSVTGALKKFAIDTLLESGQETAQQAISNLTTGKKPTEGLIQTFLVSLPISAPFGAVGLVETAKSGAEYKRTENLLQSLADTGITKEEAAATISSITGVDQPTAQANVDYFAAQNEDLNATYETNAQKKIDEALAEVSAEFEPAMEVLKKEEKPGEEAAFQKIENPAINEKLISFSKEVKKYKTAEEFVASQSAIEHATDGEIKFGETGAYFAPEGGATDSGFGATVEKRFIAPKSKIYTPEEQNTYEYLDKRGLLDEKSTELKNKYGYSTLREVVDESGGLDNPNDAYLELQRKAIPLIKVDSNNADIILLKGEDDLNPTQYVVQNKDVLINEKELVDFYNETKNNKESFKKEDEKSKIVSVQTGIEKIQEYQERLGVSFPIFVYNKIYTGFVIKGSPEEAFGMYLDNTISLAQAITRFTADHEVGHFAFRNLDKIPVFKEAGITQKDLYTELKKKYGDLSNIELEEKLMEDFEKFVAAQEEGAKKKTTFTGKIKAFFQNLYDMVADLFDLSTNEQNSIEKFYDTLYFGKGRGITTFENTGKASDFMEARFKEFGEEAPAFQKVEGEFTPPRVSQNEITKEYRDIQIEEEIPTTGQMPEELYMTGISLEMMKESLDNNPLQKLAKYEVKGVLPEVIGEKGKSEFARNGDDIITEIVSELYGPNTDQNAKTQVGTEQIRQAYTDYKETKKKYREYLASYKARVREYKLVQRDAKNVELFLKEQAKITLTIQKEFDRHQAFVTKIFGKGFKAGEKAGIVVGRKQGANKATNQVIDIKRKNELERLKENIIKRSYTRSILETLRTNIPRSEWATYMTRLTQVGTSETKFSNLLEDIYERKAELDIENKSRIDAARMRSTIAYLKKIYDIEPTLIKSIKEDLNLNKPIKEYSMIELDQFKQELLKRIQFRKDNPVRYLENTEVKTKKSFGARVKKLDQNIIAPLERKIKQISKPLYESIMTVFFQTEQSNQIDVENTKPLVDLFNKATEGDQILITKYAQSADETRLRAVLEQYATPEEVDTMLTNARESLNRIHKDLTSVGIEVPYRGMFFPRRLKPLTEDQAQLMLSTFEYKMGRKATEEERLAIITNLTRGFNPSQLPFITLSGKRFEAHRLIEDLPVELLPLYEDFATALQSYVAGANVVIEQRKFFGKSLMETMDYDKNLENSIGAKVLELQDAGLITATQMTEVRDTLQTLFSYRLSEGARAVQQFTNDYIYPLTLSQITSTISQAKDLTMQTLLDLFKGQFNLFGKQSLSAADVNLSSPIQELESSVKTGENKIAQFGKKVMTPFSKADAFFLDVFINSSYKRMVKLAKSDNIRFKKELVNIFGEEAATKLIDDLKQKTGKEEAADLPDGVKRVLFSEVAKVRPITKLQKTRAAVRSPAWYTLKNFAVKQLEFVRSQSIDLIVEGKKAGDKKLMAEGVGKLVAIMTYMALLGAGIDELKDWIIGRNKDTFWNKIVDNMLQVFGLSNYILQTGERDGFAKQTALSLAPAAASISYQFIDDVIKDVENTIDGDPIYDAKSFKRVPLVGNIYYNRLGGGSE